MQTLIGERYSVPLPPAPGVEAKRNSQGEMAVDTEETEERHQQQEEAPPRGRHPAWAGAPCGAEGVAVHYDWRGWCVCIMIVVPVCGGLVPACATEGEGRWPT